MQRLLLTHWNDCIISAVCEDMSMRTVRVLEEDSILGNIYVGRVENIVNNIQAAFIEYDRGKKGYYSFTENENHIFLNNKNTDKVCAGDLMLVQVTREGVKTKEPTLSGRIGLTGRYCAVTLKKNMEENSSVFISRKIIDDNKRNELKKAVKGVLDGILLKLDVVVRTNAENAAVEAVCNEADKLCRMMEDIIDKAHTRKAFTRMYSTAQSCLEDVQNMRATNLEKIITDIPQIYESVRQYLTENEPDELTKLELYKDELLPLDKLYSVDIQIQSALNTHVWLPSGGYLVIEPTEAMTVIDVNTGKFTGNRKLTGSTYMKINMQAADEIARQLMLRNLSGIIIVDFINMETGTQRHELMDYLTGILKNDSISTTVVDMTKLGLVEITRKKVRRPLHEMIRGHQNNG